MPLHPELLAALQQHDLIQDYGKSSSKEDKNLEMTREKSRQRFFIVFFEANQKIDSGESQRSPENSDSDESSIVWKLQPVRGTMPCSFNGYVNHMKVIDLITQMGVQDVRLTGINEITERDYADFNAGK